MTYRKNTKADSFDNSCWIWLTKILPKTGIFSQNCCQWAFESSRMGVAKKLWIIICHDNIIMQDIILLVARVKWIKNTRITDMSVISISTDWYFILGYLHKSKHIIVVEAIDKILLTLGKTVCWRYEHVILYILKVYLIFYKM